MLSSKAAFSHVKSAGSGSCLFYGYRILSFCETNYLLSIALWICCHFFLLNICLQNYCSSKWLETNSAAGYTFINELLSAETRLCFSQADKHKMERFLRPDAPTVVSIYAPITFSPAGVLLFKQRSDGEMKSLICA